MKKIFASAVVGLLSLPAIGLACEGGGDCGGMELPPPPVPAPHPQVDALLNSFSSHIGLFAGLALALSIGIVLARRPKFLAPGTSLPLGSPSA